MFSATWSFSAVPRPLGEGMGKHAAMQAGEVWQMKLRDLNASKGPGEGEGWERRREGQAHSEGAVMTGEVSVLGVNGGDFVDRKWLSWITNSLESLLRGRQAHGPEVGSDLAKTHL